MCHGHYTYDGAGKLLSATETEENQGTYTYTYGYDAMENRTSVMKTDENGAVVESSRYGYNESSQIISVELYDGKKITTVPTPMMRTGTQATVAQTTEREKTGRTTGTMGTVPQVAMAAVPPETATPPMRKRITARTSAAYFSWQTVR